MGDKQVYKTDTEYEKDKKMKIELTSPGKNA